MPRFTEWSDELAAELAKPFPDSVKQQMRKGKQAITFVSWVYYVEKLNALVGPNGWEVGEPLMREVSGRLVMSVPVTILGVTKRNVGDEREDKADFGTASTNAFAQALKRTLALFGLGLDQYDKTGAGASLLASLDGKPDSKELLAEYLDQLRLLEQGVLNPDEVGECKRAVALLKQPHAASELVQKTLDAISTIAGAHGISVELETLEAAA